MRLFLYQRRNIKFLNIENYLKIFYAILAGRKQNRNFKAKMMFKQVQDSGFLSVLLCLLLPTWAFSEQLCAKALKIENGQLQLIVCEKAGFTEIRMGELFAAEVKKRSGIEVGTGESELKKYSLIIGISKTCEMIKEYGLKYATVENLQEDGFYILTKPDKHGRIYVIGQNSTGVITGVGKLLRLCEYGNGYIDIPVLSLNDNPALSVRGMYFCAHFYNFYHIAPAEQVDRLIEDLALWGCNELVLWFDMHHFKSLQEPAAQEHLARLKHFAATAKSVGMKVGLTFLANEAYSDSPVELRAVKPAIGSYGVELCPSKPQGLELIGKWQAEVLDAFGQVDTVWSWPYDQGGCACEQCRPWASNGFLRASEQLARLFHQRNPQGRVWLSTWMFDRRIGGADARGEYADLFDYIRQNNPDWFAGLLAGSFEYGCIKNAFPAEVFERPKPEKYPVAYFPEISMYNMYPWGGYGVTPLPEYDTKIAEKLRGRIVGGWPYSEGIFEDFNKFFWIQYFCHPQRKTDDILAEYTAYYFGPQVKNDAVKLFRILEETHGRKQWQVWNLDKAEQAWKLAQSIDSRLPQWAKDSWRWRIVYVRAGIDNVLKTEGCKISKAQADLVKFSDELSKIYHEANWVFTPPASDVKIPADDLAYYHPIATSSADPQKSTSFWELVDGIDAARDPNNYWVNDPKIEKNCWVTIDLWKATSICEIRIQFRDNNGVYDCVPKNIGFEISEDGQRFQTLGKVSTMVPVEGTKYSADFWTYRVNGRGRYVRLNLAPSEQIGKGSRGRIGLAEIEVYGNK